MAVRRNAAAAGKPTAGSATAASPDLSAEEYRHCRELLLENVRSMDRNEIYTLGAVAVTMVFSLTATNPAVAIGSAMIPLALSYMARLRYMGIGIMTRTLNTFMVRMVKANPSISWTTFERSAKAGKFLRENRVFFWYVLMGGSAVFLAARIALVATGH
jgi:hypothetical protein